MSKGLAGLFFMSYRNHATDATSVGIFDFFADILRFLIFASGKEASTFCVVKLFRAT